MKSRNLPSIVGAMVAIGAVSVSCGTEGGYGRPGVTAGPLAPLTLRFENLSDRDLYITLAQDQPDFSLARDGNPVAVRRGCFTDCDYGCACRTCVPEVTRHRRIASGQSYVVTWEPVHHVNRACSEDSACSCAERWPLTAGHYDLEVRAVDALTGGEPTPEDPDVIVGATAGNTAVSCTARSGFDLAAGAEVTVAVRCWY